MMQNLVRRGALACLILGSTVAPLPLMAQETPAFQFGNSLLDMCQRSDAYAQGYCLEFAVAAFDAVNAPAGVFGYRACTPKNVTQGQTSDIVVAYLVAHPEERHFIAISVAAEALSIAFPCK